MSLLREYIHELLTEGAKTVDDLPHRKIVELKVGNDYVIASIQGIGAVTADKIEPFDPTQKMPAELGVTGNSLGAWEVSSSEAKSGWGPLLYDIVMETVTSLGAGLTCDRYSVSDDAYRIWQHYLKNRSNIQIAQLDFAPNYEVHITDDPNDDSSMPHRYDLDNTDPAARSLAQQQYLAGPLSKVYYSVGTPTLDKLRVMGKLIER